MSLYQNNVGFIFGIPNASMSSYPCFQHFRLIASLDNFVSGIPNAIMSHLFGGREAAAPDVASRRDLAIARTRMERNPRPVKPARGAAELRN
jgi:hypothetical protein